MSEWGIWEQHPEITTHNLPNGGTEYRCGSASVIRNAEGNIQQVTRGDNIGYLIPRVLNQEEWNNYVDVELASIQAIAREQGIIPNVEPEPVRQGFFEALLGAIFGG